MDNFEAYQSGKIDLTPFGLERDDGDCPYFCTPENGQVFASAGVDGIHYCRVGETILAVSPMNEPGEYVHPVARSFDDFLRLLLMLDDNAAMEQCWQWSEEQFEDFVGELRVEPETKEAALHIMERTGLTPMEQPYRYIHTLQAEFDPETIQFSEEYYETVGEPLPKRERGPWEVHFEDDFWSEEHQGELCREIPVETRFQWADRDWYIPAVYVCSQSVVLDMLLRAPGAVVRAFQEKWEGKEDGSDAQFHEMERENPLTFHFSATVTAGETVLRASQGCAIPLVSWEEDFDRWDILNHYHLDPEDGWLIQRTRFPAQPPDCENLTVTLCHQPGWVFGETFTARPGKQLAFTNPVTGTEHTFTVDTVEEHTHDFDQTRRMEMGLPEMEYPDRYRVMTYRVTPETDVRITDTRQGDRPREKGGSSDGSCAIGIIMGYTPDEGEQGKTAVSSLYFHLPKETRWQLSFREGEIPSICVSLQPGTVA